MRRLGRYEILKEIGRGSMGVVYLARDPRIGRQVALKTIHLPAGLSRSEESQYRERFRREGMAAGKLNHPNIVTVYDVGEDPDSGVSVIVMEHIEGVTLKERLDSGSLLSEQEIRRIGAQIAEALDYAHRQKVIHRDIKPANIILTREGDAKIMDFGIARLADSELTHEEQTIGSPAFMSPEQIRGDRVRAASDLFSLGVLLYMLATGRRPFEGTDTASIMYKILNENPVPPSQVPARKRSRRKKRKNSSSLSAEFDQILGQLLRKNPSERFSTGRELAEELNRHLNPDTSGKRSPVRTRKTPRAVAPGRHRVFPAAELVTALGGGVLLIGIFLLWGYRAGQAASDLSPGNRQPAGVEMDRQSSKTSDGVLSRWFGSSPSSGETGVHVRFPHRLDSGTLTVWMDGKRILKDRLETAPQDQKLFGKKLFQTTSGLVEKQIPASAGDHRFEALLECPDQNLIMRAEKKFHLEDGAMGQLVIDLDRWFLQRLKLKWK